MRIFVMCRSHAPLDDSLKSCHEVLVMRLGDSPRLLLNSRWEHNDINSNTCYEVSPSRHCVQAIEVWLKGQGQIHYISLNCILLSMSDVQV